MIHSVTPYREIKALNSSMIRLFDDSPIKFYEEFIMGKKKVESPSVSLLIGDLVDFYLLECSGKEEVFVKRFDDKYALYEEEKKTGQVFTLADQLFSITKDCVDSTGKITLSFNTRFSEAFKRVKAMKKYNGKDMDYALEDFNDNASGYFATLMENITKQTVDISLVDKSKRIAEIVKNDVFTRDIFNEELIKKVVVQWKLKGISCKSEIDMISIDHESKTIQLYDLKTTYDNENFEYSYIKNKYYIQASFYYLALEEWKKQEGLDDYTVLPMKFVVADTSSVHRRPIVINTDETDLQNGLNGFYINGVKYKGVYELVDDISWASKMDIWNCSRELIKNKGKQKLHIKYD